MSEFAVSVRSLAKRYGQKLFLDAVSFTLHRTSLTTLSGRSGSGKSTLFKLLAGLDRPSSGEILIDGTNIADLSDEQLADLRLRRIGLVFQQANLLPDLTVLENARLPLDLAAVPRGEANTRARALLALVGLADAAEKHPHTLSGGEAQRVAVARAIANDPAVLLADEPTANLDVENAMNVLALFREINARLGTTVLIITHDPLVMDQFPRRLVLRDKTVVWDDEPQPYVPSPP